jgi:hypothetical protein
MLSRWTRPSFSREEGIGWLATDLVPACPEVTRARVPQFMRPTRPAASLQTCTGPFSAPETTPRSGQTNPSPAAPFRPAEWSFRTLLGATGGDPNTLAPNRGKARRLRYARQELVRDSESNTKYGGKRGKTGVSRAPVMAPSISESTRIRQAKKIMHAAVNLASPAVHREVFFRTPPLRQRDSHMPAGESGWHVRQRVVARGWTGQIASADSPAGHRFQ